MGLQTLILDDHDGLELPSDTLPVDISIDGRPYLSDIYLSLSNQSKLDRHIRSFFRGESKSAGYEDISDEELEELTRPTSDAETMAKVTGSSAATVIREHRDASGELVTDSVDYYERGHAEREADPRFETYGFSAAEARAYCKRNDIPVGVRGLMPQSAYDALKASEDLGCESAADVRARLEADATSTIDELIRTKKGNTSRAGHGDGVTREHKLTSEQRERIDAAIIRRIKTLQHGDPFVQVAAELDNDRVVNMINKGLGRFNYCKGGRFEALSRQSEPKRLGVYGKPVVDVYVRRIR